MSVRVKCSPIQKGRFAIFFGKFTMWQISRSEAAQVLRDLLRLGVRKDSR